VIVNYNSGERVARAVAALLAQTWPVTEIVVVDNASSDGSAARLGATYPQVRVLAQARTKACRAHVTSASRRSAPRTH
jgi:GT2 family glycosyltransferase